MKMNTIELNIDRYQDLLITAMKFDEIYAIVFSDADNADKILNIKRSIIAEMSREATE